MATMHWSVIFSHGDFPAAGVFAIFMQSMPAIDARIDPTVIGTGDIAMAVDWPINPNRAISNNPRCNARAMIR